MDWSNPLFFLFTYCICLKSTILPLPFHKRRKKEGKKKGRGGEKEGRKKRVEGH